MGLHVEPVRRGFTSRCVQMPRFSNRCRRSPSCMSQSQLLTGVRQLREVYEGVLLDQFGVLHDGNKPYAGAQEAVQWMAANGMKVLILSNSSKRSSDGLQRIHKLGFHQQWFHGVITSGEVTFVELRDRTLPGFQALGRRCLHFTWKSRGSISLDGLDLQIVGDAGDADFILCHGTEALAQPGGAESLEVDLEEMKELLTSCTKQAKLIPMVVANPDVVTVSGDTLIPMPGTLAEHYAGAGGKVFWMGKPDPIIYKVALDMMQLPKKSIVAIGDSLQHDIQGAHNAGIDSVFVTGGIHAKDIAGADGEVDEQNMLDLLAKHIGKPTYTMTSLQI